MKRVIFIIFTLLITMSNISAQQTPKEIANWLRKLEIDFSKFDEGQDTVYKAIGQQIELQKGNPANLAIWHSCMAQFLSGYYESQKFRILDRTPIEGVTPTDFNVWDALTFEKQILYHFQQSLLNKEFLCSIPINEYKEILDQLTSEIYRPTLFDFLAFRYLDFMKNTSPMMPSPAETFDINNSKYWADNAIFTNISIQSPDEYAFHYLTLSTFQALTRLHLQDSDPHALIDITIRRINYLNEHSRMEGKDQISLDALLKLEKEFTKKPGHEMIAYELGCHYHTLADGYDKESAPKKKDYYVQALKWFQQVIDESPKSLEAENARVNIEQITASSISMELKQIFPARRANLITFSYKNCDKLYFRIIPTTKEEINQISNKSYLIEETYLKLIRKNSIYETTIPLPENTDYRQKNGHFLLPELNSGNYICMVSNDKFQSNNSKGYAYAFIEITNIAISYRRNDSDCEVFVVDRVSGKPVHEAEVCFSTYKNYSSKPDRTEKKHTDKDGNCHFSLKDSKSTNIKISAKWKNETCEIDYRFWGYYNTPKDTDVKIQGYLFTDRNIYRPGQIVYYKGICIKNTSVNSTDIAKELYTHEKTFIKLVDANGQDVETVWHTTNEYGSFSGSFVIPTSGLTGTYQLRSEFSSKTFKVEEYKRPTFEVNIDQPKEEFKLNQDVSITGNVKAYAGYAIEGAAVKYHVKRKASFPWWRCWWWTPRSNEQVIANGTVTTDADGTFKIIFEAQPDKGSKRYNPLYNFDITLDVTDITGETHSAYTSVLISEIGLIIQSELPEQVANSDNNKFSVKATNLSGEAQNCTLHYVIQSLKVPDNYMKDCPQHDYFLSDSASTIKALPYLDLNNETNPSSWKVLNTICEGDFVSDGKNAFSIPKLETLKEGCYKITFTTSDKDKNVITNENIVTIYNEKSSKCAFYKPICIFQAPNSGNKVGETAQIVVGTYLKEANILCEIVSNNKIVESTWIKLHQGKTILHYPITEKDLGNVVFHVFTFQNNNFFEENFYINVPYHHQDIDFDFISFRDKTTPGSEEQYQIRIKNKSGDKIAAELLCSMYDASLDVFNGSNSFNKTINYWIKKTYNTKFEHINLYNMGYFRKLQNERIYWETNTREYPRLRFDIIPSRYGRNIMLSKEATLSSPCQNAVEANIDFSSDFFMEDTEVSEIIGEVPGKHESSTERKAESMVDNPPAIRSNFNETAFFYPELHTDENGDIRIKFTLPESLTKWKLMGFAHNTDLMSGYFEKYVQASKKLMIVPNVPRFLREGDTILLSAKIVNMDSVIQCGNITLTFHNPMDGSELKIIDGSNIQAFEINPNGSQEVHFRVHVPYNIGAVTYRIVATNLETPSFSDGEEATLPVLTNRILVTESMPLHISGKGSKSFTMNRLKSSFALASPTLTTQSLTLEFTPNPIWYAIQAMPYLMEYPYECNEQIFSRYYANALSTNIVNSHPRVKQVFDEWLNSSADAFCSQLEKNQELKSVLLEETPWLLDAQNEASRKQNIAILFDLQRMAKEGKATCQKLQDRQNSDGGWPWFAGGQSNEYITEHILAGLGHLKVLNVPTDMKDNTIRKAINYADHKMNSEYQKWVKGKKDCTWSNIHYLYARSFYLDQKIPANCVEAYNYYYSNLKKDWKKQSIYMQGMTALICQRNGDTPLAKTIMANIKSMAQYDDEMGMYWKKNGLGHFWYEAPIERQALLIEAFSTITHDEKSVEQMQLWLLKQKQTQSWPTTRSTTEAIYALLLNNNQLENANSVQLSLGDWHYTEIDTSLSNEAGTGYIKKNWKGAEVKENMATVKIDKQSSGPAWGSLYWQYLENIDKVEHSQDREINIQKQLYKITAGDRGEMLTTITEESPINVGDKVRVRIEIRSDRDMEYVHLKDMRASCFEPTNVLSGYKHQDGLWYYESTRDASTNFFIDYLPKGTYVFEYTLVATMAGRYSNGLTTIQCMYAPEFTSHSEGIYVKVK